MDTPSSNPTSGSANAISYGIRPFRMPDAVWREIAGYLPLDARDRAPLLRDWIEGAGSRGLTGDTELHLHLFRAIIMAVQESAARMDKNLHLFLETQAIILQHVAEDSATIAKQLPVIQDAITRLETTNAQAEADRESLLRQIRDEREQHAETMRNILGTITTTHNDLHNNRINPLFSAMLQVPGRIDSLEAGYFRLHRLTLGTAVGVVILAVVVVIIAFSLAH
jgi:hypothetical protein